MSYDYGPRTIIRHKPLKYDVNFMVQCLTVHCGSKWFMGNIWWSTAIRRTTFLVAKLLYNSNCIPVRWLSLGET